MRSFLTSLLIVALLGFSGFTFAEETKAPEVNKKTMVKMEKVFKGVVAEKDKIIRLNTAEISYILKGKAAKDFVGKKVEVKGTLLSDNMTLDVKSIKTAQ